MERLLHYGLEDVGRIYHFSVHNCVKTGMKFVSIALRRYANVYCRLVKLCWKNKLTRSDVAFSACLQHRICTYDTSLFGLWALRAIEGEISWCNTPPLEIAIPLAHVWIVNAGSKLVLLDDDRGTAGKGGHLWDGQSGLCQERWSFWQQRFESLSRDDQLSEQARQLAVQAASRIVSLIADVARHS
jgi:hypothetical protein